MRFISGLKFMFKTLSFIIQFLILILKLLTVKGLVFFREDLLLIASYGESIIVKFIGRKYQL
jgi:hypothetical protein